MITFTDAIYSATAHLMLDKRVHIIGLGAAYPNGFDGTLGGLALEYPNRIHDTACSENAVTGMAIGMAINGLRPIIHHGRIEFALYAMGQILTEAANWNYMFSGYPCPLTVRVCIGRQWGNGPAHTRSMKGLFAAPGLKVVCPSSPRTAKGLLLAAVNDPNPVIYLEHRWLYKTKQTVFAHPLSLDTAQIIKAGNDITVVAVGDMLLEALKAQRELSGIVDMEIIDPVSIYPMDISTIQASVLKTGNLLVVESATPAFSAANEIISQVSCMNAMLVTCPDSPCPTAPAMTAAYYPTFRNVETAVREMLNLPVLLSVTALTFEDLNLPPKDNFDDYC